MERRYDILLILSLTALAAALSFQSIRSFDYWWALRTGQLIFETGSVPIVDPFTYTVLGSRWIDIHWIHQLGLYATYAIGGHAAVVVAKFFFVALMVLVMATVGYRKGRPIVSVVALTLMLLIACGRFMARPELPSFLFLAAILAILDRFSRTGTRWIYAIVGIQLLWVNVHGLFAVGIATCGIYLVAEIIRPWTRADRKLRVDRLTPLAVVSLLSILVSLLNPNFVEGALFPLHQLKMIAFGESSDAFGSMIVELRPFFSAAARSTFLARALAITSAVLALGAMLLNRRRLEASDPLLWLAFGFLMLSAQRNQALFGIVSAAIWMRNLQSYLDHHPFTRRFQKPVAIGASVLLLALAGDVGMGNFYDRIGLPMEPGFGVRSLQFPEDALEWVAREKPPGPIAHPMSDGGYLIWRLYPDYLAMSDGRLEIYGDELLTSLQNWSPEHFASLDQEYHFGSVLIHYSQMRSSRIIDALRRNPSWQLTYVDDVALIFVRIPEVGTALYPTVDLDSPELFPALEGSPSRANMRRCIARVRFYQDVRRPAKALQTLEANINLYPEYPDRQITHARLLQENGMMADVKRLLDAWIEDDPNDAERQASTAELYRTAGWARLARAHFEIALRLDPDHTPALLGRGLLDEQEGMPEEAIEQYERVVEILGDSAPVAKRAAARIEALRAEVGKKFSTPD